MARVMIVDDSAYARRVHRLILEGAGHTVTEASTGAAAIEQYSLEAPDVVVLDLTMTDMGGLDVLKTLRALDGRARVAVVSADVQRSTEMDALAGGAGCFVAKPAKPEQLLDAVSRLVQGDAAC